MGGVISQETSLADNALLKRLAGTDSIVDNDPFWNQLFSFNLKIDDNDSRLAAHIESSVSELLQALMHNTRRTGNVASLIRVFLRRAEQLRESEQYENKIFMWQCANALTVLRYVSAFLTQRMSEAEFLRTFDKGEVEKRGKSDSESGEGEDEEEVEYCSTAEHFLHSLIEIIVALPVTDYTMDVHMEAVRCTLTLLSTQLYRDSIQTEAAVFGYFLKGVCSTRCMELSRALLHNYLHHNSEYRRGNTGQKQPESIVFGLAASMWSMVQLVTGGEEEDEEAEKRTPASLGSLSVLLLLTLACHPLPEGGKLNPAKDALQHFLNSQEVSSLAVAVRTFKMDYSVLYERLCATVRQEPPMLLLYLLLHRNSGFRNYVLSRINLENLVIPVVRCLFDSTKGGGVAAAASSNQPSSSSTSAPSQHHTYLSLIVILILSEDDFFCKLIHETMVSGVEWAEPDRPLGEISLGGLIALVFIRAIHRNTLKTRDRYLHTNCLAALANMSSCFKNLAPVVCQKLIGLLEAMTKRHQKLVEHLRTAAEDTKRDEEAVNYHEEITVLEEGIRTALEIVNAALAGGCLRHNPNLIYTLLYHRSLFDSFSQHPMFQDLMVNIGLVISHFSSKILNEKSGDGSAVLARIEKEAIVWPTDRLKKFPELKFRYVEDDNTVDFFVPYIWRLVVDQSTGMSYALDKSKSPPPRSPNGHKRRAIEMDEEYADASRDAPIVTPALEYGRPLPTTVPSVYATGSFKLAAFSACLEAVDNLRRRDAVAGVHDEELIQMLSSIIRGGRQLYAVRIPWPPAGLAGGAGQMNGVNGLNVASAGGGGSSSMDWESIYSQYGRKKSEEGGGSEVSDALRPREKSPEFVDNLHKIHTSLASLHAIVEKTNAEKEEFKKKEEKREKKKDDKEEELKEKEKEEEKREREKKEEKEREERKERERKEERDREEKRRLKVLWNL
ncbi:hypothetical protein PFISCL1PPCAC_7829 [Pristionchus fissidentatus]|uniref:Dymeclin n=1 Tax=Pristionchus fissidentatus TaxID=1538716 RepID=A0AAV5VCS7_9BILA|nr:hypothetical protein PFISCL1PPCAC_7829 [Pristionchus fissidentatus]